MTGRYGLDQWPGKAIVHIKNIFVLRNSSKLALINKFIDHYKLPCNILCYYVTNCYERGIDMESLNSLAEEVAKAYLHYLKSETGSDIVTINGVSKHVDLEQLTFGLVGIVHYNSKKLQTDKQVSDPHIHLQSMINIFSRPYRLTPYGLSVIEAMNEHSIDKKEGRMM